MERPTTLGPFSLPHGFLLETMHHKTRSWQVIYREEKRREERGRERDIWESDDKINADDRKRDQKIREGEEGSEREK